LLKKEMSKAFIKFSWITLVFIFLVVVAGSVVRSTGSGMGCPDWPKCFNQVVPPTDVSELPEDYKDIYVAKRIQKVEKFAKILSFIGMEVEAEQLKNDKTLLLEQDFNWKRTWTEYGNRLVGFVAGNMVLVTLIWVLISYRQNKVLVFLSLLNLILMGFEGWMGSIVVATNLVPWILTIHMLFALVIIWIQIKIIRIAKGQSYQIRISKTFRVLFYSSILLSIIQILLGTQVRQKIDFLVADNIDRGAWLSNMNVDFYFHRSLIWLVLIVNGTLFWLNKKNNYGMVIYKYIIALILVEFLTGVLFSYAGMPAILQPIHLVVASLMLAVQLYGLKFFKYKTESLIR
jgi:cytochrome c oxidase assembly protein subunit 15